MGLHVIQWRSEVLAKNLVTMRVLVPDGPGPFPAIYLLHGLTADSSIWTRFHQIELLMQSRAVMVVMPDAWRSFYVNDPRPGGLCYEDYMVDDVRGYVERVFPADPRRSKRALVGISMGGYGALMLAVRHPDLFQATASISGSTYVAHEPAAWHRDDDVGALVSALPPDRYDLFRLASNGRIGTTGLAMRLSCGRQDQLFPTNRAFHRHLDRLGIAHEWVEHSGRHDHSTWDTQLPLALRFVIRKMEA